MEWSKNTQKNLKYQAGRLTLSDLRFTIKAVLIDTGVIYEKITITDKIENSSCCGETKTANAKLVCFLKQFVK